jgi:transcriptional regulator with XRE-family HTH domain
MKFDKWCEANPAKAVGLHKRLGVPRQTLHRYKTGERIPDDVMMPKIAKATGYQVTANDFYGIDPIKAAAALEAA